MRDGDIRQITKDQTWCRREVDEGRLSEEEASVHPMKHMLFSALGVTADYTLDVYEGRLAMSDGMLLCSDGFYSKMPDDWNTAFSSNVPTQDILDRVAEQILGRTADDNFTGILVRQISSHG